MSFDRLRRNANGHGKWLFCIVVLICMTLLSVSPQALPVLSYDRSGLSDGQLWRVFSAHFIHLNIPHLVLNAVGLVLVCELLWGRLPLRHGVGLLLSGCVAISVLLWWRHPALAWYAGSSGIVHTLWAGCALAGLFPSSPGNGASAPATDTLRNGRIAGAVGGLLLFAKLATEIGQPSLSPAQALIGAPVISVAHLYGALTGCMYVLAWRLAERYIYNK